MRYRIPPLIELFQQLSSSVILWIVIMNLTPELNT
jgi:hypothetical protein